MGLALVALACVGTGGFCGGVGAWSVRGPEKTLRRRSDLTDANWFSDRRVKGLRRKSGGDFGVILKQVIFEILGGDFIERNWMGPWQQQCPLPWPSREFPCSPGQVSSKFRKF